MKTTTKARFALNDKKNLILLREAIEENLAEFASEKGIVLKAGKIKYEGDGCSCEVTVKFTAPDATGEIKSQYEKDFERYHSMFGMKPEDLGRHILYKGEDWKVIGLVPNRRKYPVAVRNIQTEKVILLNMVALGYEED